MESLDIFVVDLALILSVASIAAVILKKLKQPVVLGYIVAGFLISPNFTMLPTVVSREECNYYSCYSSNSDGGYWILCRAALRMELYDKHFPWRNSFYFLNDDYS